MTDFKLAKNAVYNHFPDPYFKIVVVGYSDRPNLLSYLALRQCYAEHFLSESLEEICSLPEDELGRRVVKLCIKFGHWSVLEHPVLNLIVEAFPHDTAMQARTHRHLSFSMQSQRYTSGRIIELVDDNEDYGIGETKRRSIERVFYLPPKDSLMADREGIKQFYSEGDRLTNLVDCLLSARNYKESIERGYPPEHARRVLAQGVRQSFMLTANLRALLHFCDLRCPKDAQSEISQLAYGIFEIIKSWTPEVAEYYEKTRLGKNKLAP